MKSIERDNLSSIKQQLLTLANKNNRGQQDTMATKEGLSPE